MKYKAIGFDYGGVLYGQTGRFFDGRVAELLAVDVEKYRQIYFTHNKKPISTKRIWELVLSDLNREDYYDRLMALIDRLEEDKKVNVDVLNLVNQLREMGYKVGLLSNNSVQKAEKMRQQKIDSYFDAFCVSAEIGYSKPDKPAFECLAKKLDVKLNQLVFIDDEPTSLKNFADCDYRPILYTSYQRLLDQLNKIGIQTSNEQ